MAISVERRRELRRKYERGLRYRIWSLDEVLSLSVDEWLLLDKWLEDDERKGRKWEKAG